MAYQSDIVDPPFGARAFAERSEAAQLSQAAFLLLLGRELDRAHSPDSPSRRVDARDPDERMFGVPSMPGDRRRVPLGGVGPDAVRTVEEPLDQLPRLVDALQDKPSLEAAASVLRACLASPHAVVRIAAASAALEITSEPAPCIDLLAATVADDDPLLRDVAATTLARVMPEHEALRALTRRGSPRSPAETSRTSILVHGTWARNDAWWQPGGDFHGYLLAGSLPDLYAGSDRPEWSGGYSDAARLLGAQDLQQWLVAHGEIDPLLMGHSHGANVVMLAGDMGSGSRELVLLSCPVHWPRYSPNFPACGRVVSIRVHMDLVILADRGGQRFDDTRIEENVLPAWFNHSATHDRDVWRKYDVDRMI